MATKTAPNAKPATTKKSEMAPAERKERDAAKAAGLTLVDYRILTALKSGGEHSYRDIEKKTGYYSILTAVLRTEHEGSLGARGLVKEGIHDINGRDTLTFTLTAKGKKLVSK